MEWAKPQVMGNILINVGTDGIIMTFPVLYPMILDSVGAHSLLSVSL